MVDVNINSQTLEQLANQFGIAVQEIFKIYASAQAGIGIVDAISTIGAIIGTAIFIWYLVKHYQNNDKDSGDYDFLLFVIGVAGVFLVPFAIYSVISAIGYAILHVLYPEYFAIHDLLNTIKTVVPNK